MKTLLAICWSLLITCQTFSQVYPPPSCIIYNDGQLTICPPDSVPGYTGGLIGYNVLLDGEFFENIPSGSPEDTVIMTFDPLPLPGTRTFCATANYVNWISDQACDTAMVYYGYHLPFNEDWSSGSFDTNNWLQEGDYWIISEDEGDPAPSVEFNGSDGLTNYYVPLTSFVFKADSIIEGSIRLSFDLKLDSYNSTGNEKLYLQVWNWSSQIWINVDLFTNANGSFDWSKYEDVLNSTKGNLFKFRFLACGTNSYDLESWSIDNIELFRTCYPPNGLATILTEDNQIQLQWGNYVGCGEHWKFLYWHSEMYGSNSIGTGDAAEFDVAARWTPEHLEAYEGEFVGGVYFYPAESNATYSIRVWEGDSAVLMAEQQAQDIVIGQWNYVPFDKPHPIDFTQNLWVGYHINTNTGYPAGVDDGPVYNGLGNMIYWENQWQTLTDLNPDLPYNWLIEAYLGEGDPKFCGTRVYRSINDGDFIRIAQIDMTTYYIDEEVDPDDLNCYYVTNITAKNYDSCESLPTNESCVFPVTIQEPIIDDDLQIYPNPASDELFVNSSSEILELEIIDITGRVIFIERNLKAESKIDVSFLNEGIYLMKISFNDKLAFRKVLIN